MTDPAGQPATVLVADALANNGAVHSAIDLADRWPPDGAALAVIERLRASEMVPSTRTAVAHLDSHILRRASPRRMLRHGRPRRTGRGRCEPVPRSHGRRM